MKKDIGIYLMIFCFILCNNVYPKSPLNLQKIATIPGYAPGDGFGLPVNDVGDVNNDGYPDLAIGYGRYPDCPDTSRENCRRIDIYYGGDTLDIIPDLTFWDAIDIWGNMDLNGDGYIDLVARYSTYFDVGMIKVFLGSENGPDTTADFTRYGEYYYHQFGREIASGDINADGYDDLVVAAPFDDIAAYGRVYVFFGGDPFDLEPDWYYQSEEEFACYGESVACGDLNADGYADFMVGAAHDLSDKPGRIYIYSGGDTLSITPVYVYGQFNPGSWLGRQMEYVSNWNDSDYGMVLAGWVSTEDYSNGVLKIVGASEFDSLHSEIIYNTYNPHDQCFFYGFLQGYLNDDGIKDIAIGANNRDLYFYFGPSAFSCPDSIFYNVNYRLGRTIDLNSDGIDEITGRHTAIVDSNNSEKTTYIDIYSCRPFPVSINTIEGDSYLRRPDGFSLKPNYPNPFNNSTNIRFYLPNPAQIKVTVYDILGREIALLTDSFYQPSTHTLAWNAQELSSGIYFIKIHARGENIFQIQKAVLIK